MNLTGTRLSRVSRALAGALVLGFLLSSGCGRPGSSSPDLVIFATGSLFGQLHTCG